MFKKIINSKILKFLISGLLIYFAFRKVDVFFLFKELTGVKIWFLIINILISFVSTGLIAFRWSLLVIKKPKWNDVMNFLKSCLSASFYGLFFPSSIVSDALKWVIIDEKYPKIPKSKLLGSILLDRFIGMTMFVFIGFVMLFVANYKEVEVPFVIKLGFLGLFIVCLIFYVSIIFLDVGKIFKLKLFKKFKNVSELINKENLGQISKGILLCIVSDTLWIMQMWFISWYFKANISIVSIFILLPVISTILILPISIAGFGAREQLFLYFFVNQTTTAESVLLTASFSGIIGVLYTLLGGLVTLTPDFKKHIKN